MGELFRHATTAVMAGLAATTLVWSSTALAQSEPPARVGRLAFTSGSVSFHDSAETAWAPAVVNTPITTGDAIWTEPHARSEISLAGTRIRMEDTSELDMLALDDTRTRLRLSQGRIDIKTLSFDPSQPYQILTPRGTISLLQAGDYYVEAGSLEDPTRLGVRAGAARIESLNGQVLAVRPGEIAEISGDASTPQLRTVTAPAPAPPAYWAARDRQVAYDQSPQYIPAGVTGYEDLNAYGNWVDDSRYGQVWIPRATPAGWAPYRTGHWAYQQPWGWTWIDDQPWGFAPYHYGRWANHNNRWMWLPPQRDTRPVYAPAMVAFVGGVELAATLGTRSSAPVGWFPLGPREAYVPAYSTNRDYYLRLNRSAAVQDRVLDDRWRRSEFREGGMSAQNLRLMNQRYATVVPTSAFVSSQPVGRAAMRIAPDRVATVPAIPIAAPPAPTVSLARTATPQTATPPPQAQPGSNPAPNINPAANIAVTRTAVADMPTLAKPAPVDRRAAPGPAIANAPPAAAPGSQTGPNTKPALPPLAPRQGAEPPKQQAAPQSPAPEPPRPAGEPPRQQATPPTPPQSAPPSLKPGEPHKQQAAPSAPPAPQAPKPAGEPPRQQAAPAPPPAPQPPKPGEPPRQQAAPAPPQQPAPQPPKPAEPPRQQAVPAPQPQPAPQPPRPTEPPKQQVMPATEPAPQPPRQQAAPAPQPPAPPLVNRPVEQPRPQAASPPSPPPQAQHQATPQPTSRPAPPPAPGTNQAQMPPPQAHPPQQQQPQPAQPPRPSSPQQQQKPDEKK